MADILDAVIDPGRIMHLNGVPDGYRVVMALADLGPSEISPAATVTSKKKL